VTDDEAVAPQIRAEADLADVVRPMIQLETPHVMGRGQFTRGLQLGKVNNPPVTLAMDLVWVSRGREEVLGWFLAREGQMESINVNGPLETVTNGPGRIILRPNLSIIRRPRGVTAVYNGPAIEFPNEFTVHR
jgi:hypothetical protein